MKLRGHLERGSTPCMVLRKSGQSVHVTIDTGFDGDLCLDSRTLEGWRFEFIGTQEVELADGSVIDSRIFSGTILWFGKTKRVLAHETSSKECLLGTGLLRDVELKVNIRDRDVSLTSR